MSWTLPTTRATGDLITASIWNTDVVNNLKVMWHEVAGNTNGTASTTISISTSPILLVDSNSATYEAVLTRILWSFGGIDNSSGNPPEVLLYDGASALGSIAGPTGASGSYATSGVFRFTPTAGSHDYILYGQMGSGSFLWHGPFTVSIDQQG